MIARDIRWKSPSVRSSQRRRANRADCFDWGIGLVFRATAGTSYQIALISDGGSYDMDYDLTVTPSVPPSIVINQPTNHAFFEWNEPVKITAEASDPDGVVSRVDFFEDDFVLLGSITNQPFT